MSRRLSCVLRATLAHIPLALYRTRFVGEELVPEGGAILAGNHVSYLDPVLLWCGAPRPVHFMAKEELWHSRFIGWAITRLLAFPVKRDAVDRAALMTASSLLEEGELVGMFPEGTRQSSDARGELGEAHEGVAFLAMRTGVPVVPVGIHGTADALPRGAKLPRFPRVTIWYEEPVYPERFETGSRRERMEAMTAEVMRRIAQARRRAEEA